MIFLNSTKALGCVYTCSVICIRLIVVSCRILPFTIFLGRLARLLQGKKKGKLKFMSFHKCRYVCACVLLASDKLGTPIDYQSKDILYS